MKKKFLFAIIGAVGGFINGTLGSGGGTIIIPCIQKLGVDTKKSHATSIVAVLPLCIISSLFYYNKGLLNVKATMIISIGGMVGGFIGAKFLKHISGKYLKMFFGTSMIIMGIRMFWR